MTLNQPRFASDSFRLVLTHVADINSAAAWARRLKRQTHRATFPRPRHPIESLHS
jgi:hypothetical protein